MDKLLDSSDYQTTTSVSTCLLLSPVVFSDINCGIELFTDNHLV